MSFLADYLTYATNNEAPRMFHVWGGYLALSAAISRKVWLPFGVSAIYPNLFCLLVGDAGNGKSRALYNHKKLIARVRPEIHISGSQETPQGLWRFMIGDPNAQPKPRPSPVMQLVVWPDGEKRMIHPMHILANEFIDFINLDDKGWINALNNIFDEDVYHYRTKGQGEDRIVGPYISMFGGLTTDIAHDMQKQKIISTGLARRTIFQFGQRRFDDPHAILTQSPEEIAAGDRCVTHLNLLRQTTGAFDWDTGAQEWFISWYNAHSRMVPKRSPQTRSWFASKPDQVLKLAMLESLSDGVDLKLRIPHLETACHYLSILERDLHRIFGGVGRNELAGVATQMFDFVAIQTEPISSRRLKLKLFSLFSAKNVHQEFQESLQFLLDEGRLKSYALTVGNTIDVIIATPAVLEAWAARNQIALTSGPTDVVQAAIDQAALPPVDPSSVPPAPATIDPGVAPQASVPTSSGTATAAFPTLPKE